MVWNHPFVSVFCFIKGSAVFDSNVTSSFPGSRGGTGGSVGKSILVASIHKGVGCCLWGLLWRLESWRGVGIFSLCLFWIQCACVHSLTVIYIFTIFCVLCSRVCVDLRIGTISRMLCICYHQGYIVLEVCASSLYLHHIFFSLIISISSILLLLCGVY